MRQGKIQPDDGNQQNRSVATERGWVVTLFNNNGVFKPQQGLAQVDRSATVIATLSVKTPGIAAAQEWISDQSLAVKKQSPTSDSVTVSLAPGGIAIVELRPRP